MVPIITSDIANCETKKVFKESRYGWPIVRAVSLICIKPLAALRGKGDGFLEPRVAAHTWFCHLINCPRLEFEVGKELVKENVVAGVSLLIEKEIV